MRISSIAAACRKTHQEIKVMNKILEETLAHEKPDPVFEQRMLAGFRNRVPQRSGLVKLLVPLNAFARYSNRSGRRRVARTCADRTDDYRRISNRFARTRTLRRGTICCATVTGSSLTSSSIGRFSQVRRRRHRPTTGFGSEGTTAPRSSSVERRGTVRVLRWNERSLLDQIFRLLRKKSRKLQCRSLLQRSSTAS